MNRADSLNNSTPDNKAMRLFAGIACADLPKVSVLLQELKKAAPGHEHGIRVVPEQNLHITLKFLGSTDSSAISHVAAMLDQIAEGITPFVLQLTGVDTFKDALWLGVEPHDCIGRLASAINQELTLLGFRAETRPFTPHLTLARLKQRAGTKLQMWCQQRKQETWGSVYVKDMHLYESQLLPTGARYSVLHTASFKHPD